MKKNILIFFVLIIFISCSSAPKDPGDIFVIRTTTEQGLESANREAARGNFTNAHTLLTGHKRNAILVDDPSLIIRVCLSLGNVLFSLGRTDDAFTEWDYATEEARKFGNGELVALSNIYRARGSLITRRESADAVLQVVITHTPALRNRMYVAFSWQVRGLALRALERYTEAEAAIRQSLSIHENDRRLENASYDWYVIGSIRSLSGNFEGSIEALQRAIALDRRIENSWGLAASWRALGDVYRRTQRNDEAREAYTRARAIYAAMLRTEEVADIDQRMRN